MNGTQKRHEIAFWPKVGDQNEKKLIRKDSDKTFNAHRGSEEYLSDNKDIPNTNLNSKFYLFCFFLFSTSILESLASDTRELYY